MSMLISEAFPMAALIGMCLQAIKLNDRAFIMMKPFVVRGHACLLKTERERERDGTRDEGMKTKIEKELVRR